MKKIFVYILVFSLGTTSYVYSQKGKNKGGGNQNTNIKIKTDQTQVKVKTNGKNDQVKINVKDKSGKGDKGNDIKIKDQHDNGNHYGHNKSKTVWFFGPGDIYMVKGKSKRQKIVVFDQVCVRLTVNIGYLFGLIGDVRIKLDTKKATMKPAKYKKIKGDLDFLNEEVRLLEIKKNKIKLRLAKLKQENGNEDDQGENEG